MAADGDGIASEDPGGVKSAVSDGYQSASQRSQDPSTASQDYQSASQGSRNSREPPEPMAPDPEAPDAVLPGAAASETGRDYLSIILEAEARKQDRGKRLRERNLNVTESTLLEELEAYVEDERPSPPTSQQVGVRLRPAQWNRLLLVARWSGVRPTTMARILINRGARAIIDEELRYRRRFGPEAD